MTAHSSTLLPDAGTTETCEPAGPEQPRPGLRGLVRLTVLVTLWYLVLLGGWLPHYLTWPWLNDHDHFAMATQLWHWSGKLPYRDDFSMQFPGEFYFFWAVQKLVGWGNTVGFNAIDAGMVVGYGLLLVATSKKQFGRILPASSGQRGSWSPTPARTTGLQASATGTRHSMRPRACSPS